MTEKLAADQKAGEYSISGLATMRVRHRFAVTEYAAARPVPFQIGPVARNGSRVIMKIS